MVAKDFEVSLPRPCGENWDAMAPQGCNRHCDVCQATIHDLSRLTLKQAESLLASGDKVCVRAQVSPDGSVALTDSGASPRRMVARGAATAAVALALAACSTLGGANVTPLYEITGKTDYREWGAKAILTDETGRQRVTSVGFDNSFRFHNLRPGKFTLRIERNCGDPIEMTEVTLGEGDLSLGTVPWGEDQCIIVGVMQPIGSDWRG